MKVGLRKENQISFDNNVTQFSKQQPFLPGETDPLATGGIPSTIGHETIEESPENEVMKSEKSLISYRNEDDNRADKI